MPKIVETTADERNKKSSYVGALANLPIEARLSLCQPNDRDTIPAIRIFLAKYHAYPCILYCYLDDTNASFHTTTIFNYIRDELKHDLDTDCIVRYYCREAKELFVDSRLSDIGNGIIIDLTGSFCESDIQNPNKFQPDFSDNYFVISRGITIYYLPEHDKFVQDLSKCFSKMIVYTSKSSTLEMVCRNQCGYYLSSINIKKPLITDLALHYGKDFTVVHEKILKNLNKKEGNGIVLLHGIPGSGKTHYIRYLIQEIEEKTLIYVPPDMAKEISSPEFLPFLMRHQDSVLIIEDAENIIKDRNDCLIPSQAVANLLNLSDGLLGDAMHQQIIATFNCDLKSIDPALLREGRLIANYEFGKLDLESSKILSEKLGYGTENITEPMTLAEIYNQGETEKISSKPNENTSNINGF